MKIKFITLNIWEGGKLFDSVVSFIKKEKPDIIVMQEVRNGRDLKFEKRFRTLGVFREELEYSYSVFSPSFLNITSVGNVEEGNAIFSKFPIVNQDVTFFDVPYGRFSEETATGWEFEPTNMNYAVVDTGNVKVNVFNVHGIWGLDGGDNPRRLKMSEVIVEKIKNKKNVILAGDFNVLPNTKTVRNIEKYLTNVFKDDLTTTFNMEHKDKKGYATSVVDMVFVSRNIKILDHFCPEVDISDHFPLVCNLEI